MKLEKGVAAVELAVLLLFLIPLLVGIIDVARLIYSHIALQEAAQEGAMLASFEEHADVEAITSRVMASTSFPPISDDEITVSCSPDPRMETPGTTVSVEVQHDLDLLLPFTGTTTVAKTVATDRFFGTCPS